jgi:hypothetical protein
MDRFNLIYAQVVLVLKKAAQKKIVEFDSGYIVIKREVHDKTI